MKNSEPKQKKIELHDLDFNIFTYSIFTFPQPDH